MKLIATVLFDNGTLSKYTSDFTSEDTDVLDGVIEVVQDIYQNSGNGFVTIPGGPNEVGTLINVAKTSAITFEVIKEGEHES
ncbi:hypothetical protein [Listeria cornellensis]|uniref:Uncharacterized protein n=1 Tax=Listeria cornellensis FSL F6-0969 TaxID=1265820 RepID=W7BY18_9LIST|nr:hypothetical protein [Listeria cornellensis]EUJ29625.1 hypothetical protein PCORN_10782 [Listeria cornellensis FSL F6-0969]